MNDPIARLGQGMYWQDLQPGQRWRTFRRTITEADLVHFINATGMLEAIFIEDGYEGGAIRGRPVPGALTYTFIEGFILQTMIQGTGLAMLGPVHTDLRSRSSLPACQSRRATPCVCPHAQGVQRRVARWQAASLGVARQWGHLRRCPRLQGMSLAARVRLASDPAAGQRDPQISVNRP